jgi:hypothetical protein
MEYWSDGVMLKSQTNIPVYPIFQYSITPPFHKNSMDEGNPVGIV